MATCPSALASLERNQLGRSLGSRSAGVRKRYDFWLLAAPAVLLVELLDPPGPRSERERLKDVSRSISSSLVMMSSLFLSDDFGSLGILLHSSFCSLPSLLASNCFSMPSA